MVPVGQMVPMGGRTVSIPIGPLHIENVTSSGATHAVICIEIARERGALDDEQIAQLTPIVLGLRAHTDGLLAQRHTQDDLKAELDAARAFIDAWCPILLAEARITINEARRARGIQP